MIEQTLDGRAPFSCDNLAGGARRKMGRLMKALLIGALSITAGLFVAPDLSRAADGDPDCRNAQTQQELTECAIIEVRTADVALSVAYKKALVYLKTIEEHTPADWKGGPASLEKAQRAWITFRDEHCRSKGLKFGGGSITPLVIHSCRAKLTRHRTQQLNDLAEEG